jgi:hypothetical protein
VVDLLALSSEARLDQVFTQLFQSEATVKLSMDASQDIKKMAGIAKPSPAANSKTCNGTKGFSGKMTIPSLATIHNDIYIRRIDATRS